MASSWTCAVCGAVHEGTPLDWAFDAPAYWNQARDAAEGFLNSDRCVIRRGDGESDHFIRGVIEIPIIDGEGEDEESFGIGAWVSLSEPNFKWYVDHPKADDSNQGDPWCGWLSNTVPVYPETLNLKTAVCLRGERWRPRIQVQPIIRSRWTSGTESRSPAPTTFSAMASRGLGVARGPFANARAVEVDYARPVQRSGWITPYSGSRLSHGSEAADPILESEAKAHPDQANQAGGSKFTHGTVSGRRVETRQYSIDAKRLVTPTQLHQREALLAKPLLHCAE